MLRRFTVRFLLGILAAWLGALLLPGVGTDGAATPFILVGLFLAVGGVVIPIIEGAAAVLLFFLPRTLRVFLLRGANVAIAAALVTGFGFGSRPLVGLVGLTFLLGVLYMLPFAR
jgi:hypothetical protein